MLNTPHAFTKGFTLWILLIVIGIKEIMFRYVLNVGNKIKSQAVKADAHSAFQSICTMLASTFAGLIWFYFGASATFKITGAATLLIIIYFLWSVKRSESND